MLVRQHPLRRLLRHQEAAEGADGDRLRDLGRHQVDKGTARAAAGVIDHEVGRAELALDQAEQPLDLVGVGGVAGKGAGPGLGAERAELLDLARGQRDLDALLGEAAAPATR